jgi:8-oxo-dGTP pyrophosphatase MutT (NUDIX family)
VSETTESAIAGVPDPRNPWRTLDSRVVYANEWITVREDSVTRPDGQPGIYGVVEIRPSVGIVALDAEGRVALVSQWRYTLGKLSLEIPSGGSETDEALLQAAARELAEEAGVAASSWVPLGVIDNSNGVTTDVAHMFLARSLEVLPEGFLRPGDEAVTVSWLPLEDAVAKVLAGEITESVSVAALLKAAVHEESLVRASQLGSGGQGGPSGRPARSRGRR